jgi:hypothetical protein
MGAGNDQQEHQKWTPGAEVEVLATRLRLRSLRESDIPGDEVPPWYGDAARREHVWTPPIKTAQFLRGLAKACNHKEFFAFLALVRDTDEPVGMSKGQIIKDGDESLFVMTTLLGQARHESLMWGYEISSAVLWFAMTHLPVDGISLRIYDKNQTVVQMIEDSGYTRHRSYDEKTPEGTKLVHDYRKSKEAWLARYRPRFSDWIVRKAPA